MEDDEVPLPLLSPCVQTLESPTGSNQVLQLRSCHGMSVEADVCTTDAGSVVTRHIKQLGFSLLWRSLSCNDSQV